MAKILIVDDEMPIRRTLREILEFEQYDVDEASDGLECVSKVQKEKYDVVIMDIKMPKMDGIEALERLQILSPETPVIMVSGHGTIDTAVEAVKKGAFDFISKPPDLNRMLITVRNAMERADLVNTTRVLRKQVKSSKGVTMIGESAPIAGNQTHAGKSGAYRKPRAHHRPERYRQGTRGALDTRKKQPRRRPHGGGQLRRHSGRTDRKRIVRPQKRLLHRRYRRPPRQIRTANGGTLFLDEIGDMSLDAQAKVLRALQESKITRVGDSKEIKVDVRVLAATNKDLREPKSLPAASAKTCTTASP
jgi:two-component system nitrogen regulation response regulator NtrX